MLQDVLIGAGAGALAALVSFRLVRDPSGRRLTALITFVVAFAVAREAAHLYLGHRDISHAVDDAIAANPAIKLLLAQNDTLRRDFRAFAESLAAADPTSDQAYAKSVEWGRKHLSDAFAQYARVAPDSSIVNAVTVLVDVLKALERTPSACVQYLYGGTATVHVSELPRDKFARMSDAMGVVIQTAISAPQPPIAPQETQRLQQHFRQALATRYTPEQLAKIRVLADPAQRASQPEAACEGAVEIYQTALGMNPSERGPLLRSLFQSTR